MAVCGCLFILVAAGWHFPAPVRLAFGAGKSSVVGGHDCIVR